MLVVVIGIEVYGEEFGGLVVDLWWVWVLDFIDGIINYVVGLLLVVILLGLLYDGVLVVGLIWMLFIDLCYIVVVGGLLIKNGVL